MYYRRKKLLALIERFGEELKPTRFQKLLPVFTRRQQKPAFEFVPGRYGAFSFHLNTDLHSMINFGDLNQGNEEKKGKLAIEANQLLNLIERYNYFEGQNSI